MIVYLSRDDQGSQRVSLCDIPVPWFGFCCCDDNAPEFVVEFDTTPSPFDAIVDEPLVSTAAEKALSIICCSWSFVRGVEGGFEGAEPSEAREAEPDEVPVRARALASSSTSSNTSCLTALME